MGNDIIETQAADPGRDSGGIAKRESVSTAQAVFFDAPGKVAVRQERVAEAGGGISPEAFENCGQSGFNNRIGAYGSLGQNPSKYITQTFSLDEAEETIQVVLRP